MDNVYQQAKKRISTVFDFSPKIILSFSGGKDSSVTMHLVAKECRRRKRKVALMIIDLEAQYKATISHIERMIEKYKDCFELYWIALPISLRNAVSVFEPQWICWDRTKEWVREKPKQAITDEKFFPFYEYAMEFEDFVPQFADWYSTKDGKKELTTTFVCIRTQESLRRWKAIHQFNEKSFLGKKYLNIQQKAHLINAYPIYDWKTEDIWCAVGRNNWEYNKIYDLIYQSGKSIHEARICQPYGDDQREGLDLFRKCEPESWGKIVQRVSGANFGNIYRGSFILGNNKVILPKKMTWKKYLSFLLKTIPRWQKHWYQDKFDDWMNKWNDKWREYRDNNLFKFKGDNRKLLEDFFNRWERDLKLPIKDRIRDEEHQRIEAFHLAPSYRRLVKIVMKNDILCNGIDGGRVPRLYYKLKDYQKKYGD